MSTDTKHGAHNTSPPFPLPLPTATRHHYTYSPHPYHGREDCWSETATAVLIKAWGDRYLHLNRGNLRQKDWKDVANSVNSSSSVKTPKTDVQCKNRTETIKKKYKQEKSKLPLPSKCPFYSHLHNLFAATGTATAPPPVKHKSSFLPIHKLPSVKPYRRSEKLNPLHPNIYSGGSSSKSRNCGSSSRSHGDNDGDRGDSHAYNDDAVFDEDDARKHRLVQDSSDGAAFRELARAILKFGEVYERIDSSKQQQMMELERQRMEFTKDFEFQRMQMFMEAQLGLEKIKRPKYSSRTGKKL